MRKFVTAMVAMLLLSMPLLCFAQDDLNKEMVAGDTVESELGYDDVQADSTLGGILGTIEFHWKRYVQFLGADVWKDETYTLESDFDLFVLPTGQGIPADWDVLTDEGTAYTSEEYNGAIYDTHEYSYDLLGAVEYDTLGEGTGGNYGLNEAICTGIAGSLKRQGSPWTPSGVHWFAWTGETLNTGSILCKFSDGSSTYIAVDSNGDLSFSSAEKEVVSTGEDVATANRGTVQFTAINGDATKDQYEAEELVSYSMYGVSTVSSSGEALAILPAGTVDVYGVV